jgi:peptidoglycan/xylan/chitin deacetylase (PgdA/CDA1 family)
MKAIMYHYVRPDNPELPYFRHLSINNFEKQLDYFGDRYGFLGKDEFFECVSLGKTTNGVVLTFDDGFVDHFTHVLPALQHRRLWGIFYIPTATLASKELLDVHRIHVLLGKHGGKRIAKTTREMITDDMISTNRNIEFNKLTYVYQTNSESVTYIKRLLNYFVDYKYRKKILDELMSVFFPKELELKMEFYMNQAKLTSMVQAGMILGSHTVNHPVMSRLDSGKQEKEIVESFSVIDSIVNKSAQRNYCHPYGGFHSFTDETERLLDKHSCKFSFNVEPRDIDNNDLSVRPQALPRYDCNAFPHGSCRTF